MAWWGSRLFRPGRPGAWRVFAAGLAIIAVGATLLEAIGAGLVAVPAEPVQILILAGVVTQLVGLVRLTPFRPAGLPFAIERGEPLGNLSRRSRRPAGEGSTGDTCLPSPLPDPRCRSDSRVPVRADTGFAVRKRGWSGRRDSNPRHLAWEASTLPTELLPLGSSGILRARLRQRQSGPADASRH